MNDGTWRIALHRVGIEPGSDDDTVTPRLADAGMNWRYWDGKTDDDVTLHANVQVWEGADQDRPGDAVWEGESDRSRVEALGRALAAYFAGDPPRLPR